MCSLMVHDAKERVDIGGDFILFSICFCLVSRWMETMNAFCIKNKKDTRKRMSCVLLGKECTCGCCVLDVRCLYSGI